MKNLIVLIFVSFLTIGAFAQSKSVVSCKIWNPESFCDIPDSLITMPRIINADTVFAYSISCNDIDKKENKTAVWLTLSTKDGSSLMFVSGFKNISLINKTNDKKIHPFAILWSDFTYNENGKSNLHYMTSAFKTSKYKSKFSFQKKIDLILIFPNAEKGDKIIIDDFIEAEIQ